MNKYGMTVLTFCMVFIAGCGGEAASTNEEDIPVVDVDPEPFIIPTVDDASTVHDYTSDEIVVSGINEPITIKVDGCAYSINGNEQLVTERFITEPRLVDAGDKLSFRMTSSSEWEASTFCDIELGSYQTRYQITTRGITTVQFFHAATMSSESPVGAPVSRLFLHGANGTYIEELSSIDGHIASFEQKLPLSFTALFEEEDSVRVVTVLELTESLDAYSVSRLTVPTSDTCKSISFDRSNLVVSDEILDSSYWLGVQTPHFCGFSGITSTSGDTHTRSYTTKDLGGIEDDLSLLLRDAQRNILAYTFLASSDYADGASPNPIVLNTDFVQIPVIGNDEGDTRASIRAAVNSNLDFQYRIGELDVDAGIAQSEMNVITLSADRYRLVQRVYYRTDLALRYIYKYSEIDELPSLIDNSSFTGNISYLAANFDTYPGAMVSWQSTALEDHDRASIIMRGDSMEGKEIYWSVDSPNTGNINVSGFTYSSEFDLDNDIYVSVRLNPSTNSNENYRSAFASFDVECSQISCFNETSFNETSFNE